MSELLTCERCGGSLDVDEACPVCDVQNQELDDLSFAQQFEPIAAEPRAHEANELAVALFALQNPERYDAPLLAWAKSVVERYIEK